MRCRRRPRRRRPLERATDRPRLGGPLARTIFNWRKVSIYGGSNEIQKNIIAKAILGL